MSEGPIFSRLEISETGVAESCKYRASDGPKVPNPISPDLAPIAPGLLFGRLTWRDAGRESAYGSAHEQEEPDLPCRDQISRGTVERNLRVGNLQEPGCLTHPAITATLCLSHGGIS